MHCGSATSQVIPMKVLQLSFKMLAITLLLSLAGASVVHAAPGESLRTATAARSAIVGQIGSIGVMDDDPDAFISLEYRFATSWHGIRPWAGVFVVDSPNTWFVGAGLMYELRFEQFAVTIGTGPFYHEGGNEFPYLGYDLEFYSFIEASYEFSNGPRLGVRLGHFSNAGLSDHNPGTETLAAVISFPFGR